MSDDGKRVAQRRERVGLKPTELARLAGINRDTVAAIEKGQGFRRSSLSKIEKALDEAEHEAGIHVPPQSDPGTISFTVTIGGEPEMVVTVEGQAEDRDQLREDVAYMLRHVRETGESPIDP